MRASEILVAWLLREAAGEKTARPVTAPAEDPNRGLKTRLKTAIALVYGPDIPSDGYYAVSRSWAEVLQQLREGFKMPANIHQTDMFNRMIATGYTLLCRVDGFVAFYGKRPVKITPQVQEMFGITGLSTIQCFKDAGGDSENLYACDEFGVELTDAELDQENAAKAADKEWRTRDAVAKKRAARQKAQPEQLGGST